VKIELSDVPPSVQVWVARAEWALIAVAALVLAGTLSFVALERTWIQAVPATPEAAFYSTSTGTELMPLAVYQVLFDLFPDQFQPAGESAGDWIDQYGLIRGVPDRNEGLPMGFSISSHRPRSGAPSPIKFVGLNCSLCHTSRIKRYDDDPGIVVLGMGTISLDFIAWVDAFKTAILDERRLTVGAIDKKYHSKYGRSLTAAESLTIDLWLGETRATLKENLPKTDEPYSGRDVRNPDFMPNGPSRTQPFRNLVRNVLNLPGGTDRAFCKIPTLYEQQERDWGQYDGSVHDRLTRSVLAAVAVGATPDNLVIDDISQGVEKSIQFTLTLEGPSYAKTFPEAFTKIDPQAIVRGKTVYMAHCDSCHGHADGAQWVRGARQDEVVPIEEIGTDPERVNFRYRDTLPDSLVAYFPERNPLRPKREDLRPGPLGTTRGYLNTPIHSAFSHVPLLHNGSVLTLAELINLRPRRPVFYRGDNLYDPDDAGLIAADKPDVRRYYRFDTQKVGNSNAGHDYPWRYQWPGWDKAALADLLAYLKTI
jgi:hypothetical protein